MGLALGLVLGAGFREAEQGSARAWKTRLHAGRVQGQMDGGWTFPGNEGFQVGGRGPPVVRLLGAGALTP